jgi:GT2 family glycosyltransferase
MMDADLCPVTAIVPACRRRDRLLETLRRLEHCRPAPAEIVVHVDGGDPEIVASVRTHHSSVRVLTSEKLLGPGGARNRMIASATNELVANFDDDSFPAEPDYFARVMRLAERFPEAAILSAASHEKEWHSMQFQSIAMPSGCGCVFRKSWFMRTSGFVPLPVAYNMEEVDIGLQLHALGGVIVHDPFLRVIHKHATEKEINPETNARVLANTALFPFLRFPAWLWPLGAWSVFRRVLLLVAWNWTAGLLKGLRMIPDHLARHKNYRRVMASPSILSWLILKRWPRNLGDANSLDGADAERIMP